MTDPAAPQDVRALLGMHTGAAKIVIALYDIGILVTALTATEGLRSVAPGVVAALLVAAGTIALVAVPGDPMPMTATALVAAIGPVASAMVLAVSPSPFAVPLQGWTHGAATMMLCFLCVRGRRVASWMSLAGTAIVYGAWSVLTGRGFLDEAVGVMIDGVPLAMATILSFTLRPTAKAVFVLRHRTERQVSEQAALAADATERAEQRRRLDRLARPLLTRIAEGRPLTAEEKLDCELLEAHLRDHLRAPVLSVPNVDEAARAARRRGIEVMLIDDGGVDEGERADLVRSVVARELDSAVTGVVRIRVLPPGRDVLASIYVDDGDDARRVVVDGAGRVRSDSLA